MRKNRRGFTLVELLAAIVILGILAVFSIPRIVGMLDRSKNKMYVDDTKKLISKVEYQMRSSSNDIEIPDPGDCIVISLVYLDSSDFDNPPNKGKYLKNYSFVVVKNNGGKLDYSATLVEKYGGSYKGVELTTSDELYSSRALSHVKTFELEKDLYKVEKDSDKNDLKTYINGKISGYIDNKDGEVSYIYNNPAKKNDNILTGDSFTPKFSECYLQPSRSFYDMNPILHLRVTDADTARKDLKVYIGYEGYNEIEAIPYGNSDQFVYNVSFEGKLKFGYDTGGPAYLYVMVEDPDKNTVKRKLEYQIHKNVKPVIDEDGTTISKRGGDKVNLPTASVKLAVTDDMDPLNELRVCFVESDTNTFPENKCVNDNEYFYYTSPRFENNTTEYSFNNRVRDGSKHYLKVFVRDSLGLTSSYEFDPYVYSTNTKPSFKEGHSPKITSIPDNKVEKSNKLSISFIAEDDLGPSNLTVTITDGTTTKSYNYSDERDYEFVFDSNKPKVYDGTIKNIVVTVTDSEGGTINWNKNYTLYKNDPPELNFEIIPTELPCINQDMCSSFDKGNLNVNLYIVATDDIDNDGNLDICITENSSNCTNYFKYSNYMNKPYPYRFSGTYDGLKRNLYVYARDSYGTTKKITKEYSVYKNQPPLIEKFEVVSETDENGIKDGGLKVKFNVSAKDDFDNANQLSFKFYEDNSEKINGTNNFAAYNDVETEYVLSGGYDGKTRKLVAEITDRNGAVSTATVNYSVFEDKLPTTTILSIVSEGQVCNNADLCLGNEGGSEYAKLEFMSFDDMTDPTELKFCLSENENGCTDINSYESYSSYYKQETGLFSNVPYTFELNGDNPYDGSTKKLYLFTLDKSRYNNFDPSANKSVTFGEYVIYENQKPFVLEDPTITRSDDFEYNGLNAVYRSYVEDDLDDQLRVKYCRRSTPGESNTSESSFDYCTEYEPYEEIKELDSNFFGQNYLDGKTFYITAKVKDRYGLITDLDEVSYTLAANGEPIIENFATYYEKALDNSKVTVHYYFKVFDFSDTYSVCVNNEDNCSNYIGSYDGNSGTNNVIDVDYASGTDVYNRIMDSQTVTLYLFVKDSSDAISSSESDVSLYEDCDLPYESTDGTDDDSMNYDYSYIEPNESGKIYVNDEYIDAKPPITMELCGGKCYSNDTVNTNIVSYYNKKITYKDRFKPSISCGNDEIEVYEANCSYKDCFRVADSSSDDGYNYERYAIGTQHIVETDDPDEAWKITIGDEELACFGYYNLYISKYNKKMEYIELIAIQDEPICDTAVDRGYYDYDKNSRNPYVRVDDSVFVNGDDEDDDTDGD